MAVVRRRDDCIHKPVCVECGAISCPAECGHYIKVEKFTSYNSESTPSGTDLDPYSLLK